MALDKEQVLNGFRMFKAGQDTFNEEKFLQASDIAGVWHIKGSVDTYGDLPANASEGDVYNIKTAGGTDDYGNAVKAGDNVVRTSDGKWDILSGAVDLSNYVEKDGSKVLSTNDFTDTAKSKLDSIEAGAQVNVIEGFTLDGVTIAPDANKVVNVGLSGIYVHQVAGKGLSKNDFTDAYKTKLDNLVEETITKADIDALFTSN